MNNQIAQLDEFGMRINFTDTFTTANNTDITTYNNWLNTVYAYAQDGVAYFYPAQVNSNAFLIGRRGDLQHTLYGSVAYNPASKWSISTCALVRGTGKISVYRSSSGNDGASTQGYYLFHTGTTNGNFGIYVYQDVYSNSFLQVYNGGTLLGSTSLSLGNTDGNYFNFDFELTHQAFKIWVYQGSKPTNPTVTYSGDYITGKNLLNTYTGILSYYDCQASYTTILRRFDDFNIEIII